MNTIKYIICTSFLLLLSVQLFAQERNILWLHGLGEDHTTWNHYEEIFEDARLIQEYDNNGAASPGYSSWFNTLSGHSTSMKNHMNSRFRNDLGDSTHTAPSNLGIGHSMGGVVLREMHRSAGTTHHIGGIITVVSPNNGAQIVNSMKTGAVAASIGNGCNKLARGPLSQMPLQNWIIGGMSRLAFCGILEASLLNPLANFVDEPGSNDLEVGTQAISNINSHNFTIPQIAIWGNEESPVHWRTVSSTINVNNDQSIVLVAQGVEALYGAFMSLNIAKAASSGIMGFVNPIAFIGTAIYSYRAVEWDAGRRWLRNSEDDYLTLIGATGTQSYTYQAPGQTTGCTFSFFNIGAYINCITQCQADPNCPFNANFTQTVILGGASDGFIASGSQVMNGISPDNEYEARGVNHMEQVNTSGSMPNNEDVMRVTFNRIFSNRGSGDFFTTPTR